MELFALAKPLGSERRGSGKEFDFQAHLRNGQVFSAEDRPTVRLPCFRTSGITQVGKITSDNHRDRGSVSRSRTFGLESRNGYGIGD